MRLMTFTCDPLLVGMIHRNITMNGIYCTHVAVHLVIGLEMCDYYHYYYQYYYYCYSNYYYYHHHCKYKDYVAVEKTWWH